MICDLLVGLDGLGVIDVSERGDVVRVVVETPAEPTGCRTWGSSRTAMAVAT